MSLTDKVAAFIHKSHVEVATQSCITVKELYESTKAGFVHDNPRTSVQFQLSVRVGDLYRPTSVSVANFGKEAVLLLPFERYMIYSLSSESNTIDMLPLLHSGNNQPVVKCIMLKYEVIDLDGEIDIEDIKGVFSTVNPGSIFCMLEHCKLVGNLKHLIT